MLEDDINTSAGLHFMASVRKKVIEHQDASTNTDPDKEVAFQEVVSECHKDEKIHSSTSEHESLTVPQILIPDAYLNVRLTTEVSEQPLSPSASDMVGHTYINVIDIEADELQELPVKKESSADVSNQQYDHLEVPFSAELHYMAASVTNDVPVHKVKSDESTSNTMDLVFKPAQMSESCLTGRSWRAVITEVQEPTSKSPPPLDVHLDKARQLEQFTSEMLKIDEQLLAIQNIAENIEQNFPKHILLHQRYDKHVTSLTGH